MDLTVSNDYRELPLTESMQGITVGDIVSVSPGKQLVQTWHAEGIVLGIRPMQGTALVELPIEGTKRSYRREYFALHQLTPIG